jgi:hypothetical protein
MPKLFFCIPVIFSYNGTMTQNGVAVGKWDIKGTGNSLTFSGNGAGSGVWGSNIPQEYSINECHDATLKLGCRDQAGLPIVKSYSYKL